jgi:cyclohexanone monooxygenase
MTTATRAGRAAQGAKVTDFDVVVIGAGMSGMYMLHRLRDELGMSVRVYERGDGPGGTWYWNRYPGARCDSESHIYSYSFSPELQAEWEFSSTYPGQPEILEYLNFVAEKFGLRRDIRFSTAVTGARFDEDSDTWTVATDDGGQVTARFVIAATGCLSAKNVPDFPGLDSFTGESYHTGAWPHQDVDFTGKRVGIIGTGATAIQIIPSIAADTEHLTVFQRTPNYSVPAANPKLSPQTWREFQQHNDAIRARTQETYTCFSFDVDFALRLEGSPESLEFSPEAGGTSALEVSPDERDRRYERDWNQGGIKFVFGSSFNDLILDPEANDTAAEFVRKKIREIVRDPATAETLCPTGHPIGTKRPPVDTLGYYETFNRDNVSLVDVKNNPVAEITPEGVKLADGTEYTFDVIIFATGFDAMTGSLVNMDIRGTGGQSLAGKWADGPRSYLGLACAGFPNLFTITGPGSPSVLTNMLVSIEQHVEWIAECLAYLTEHGHTRIEATPAAEDGWVEHANQVVNLTLLPQADSWWRGANVPGKPLGLMPYVGGAGEYRRHCNRIAEGGYEGFTLSRNRERMPA